VSQKDTFSFSGGRSQWLAAFIPVPFLVNFSGNLPVLVFPDILSCLLIFDQTFAHNLLHKEIILPDHIRPLTINDSSPHFPALLSGELSEVVRAAFQN